MSGGVDSSAAAALLVRQGYEVVGLMMRLWGEPQNGGGVHNRCCSPDAMAQARRVADLLDIPFYAIDAQAPFKSRVVDFFTQGYVAGVTPNPCLECNRHIRWDFLLKRALALDAQHLATGHYARVRRSPAPLPPDAEMQAGKYELLKGVDEKKDQSYVLSVMGQAQLAHAMFPVGNTPSRKSANWRASLTCPSPSGRRARICASWRTTIIAGFCATTTGAPSAPARLSARMGA